MLLIKSHGFYFLGRLQNLISSSCIEHLDFMNVCDPDEINTVQFKQLEHDYIGYQSLTDVPTALAYPDDTRSILVSLSLYSKSFLQVLTFISIQPPIRRLKLT